MLYQVVITSIKVTFINVIFLQFILSPISFASSSSLSSSAIDYKCSSSNELKIMNIKDLTYQKLKDNMSEAFDKTNCGGTNNKVAQQEISTWGMAIGFLDMAMSGMWAQEDCPQYYSMVIMTAISALTLVFQIILLIKVSISIAKNSASSSSSSYLVAYSSSSSSSSAINKKQTSDNIITKALPTMVKDLRDEIEYIDLSIGLTSLMLAGSIIGHGAALTEYYFPATHIPCASTAENPVAGVTFFETLFISSACADDEVVDPLAGSREELGRLEDKLLRLEILWDPLEDTKDTIKQIKELKTKIAAQKKKIRYLERKKGRKQRDTADFPREEEDERRAILDRDYMYRPNHFTSEEKDLLVSPSALDSEIEAIKDQIRTKRKENSPEGEIGVLQDDLERTKELRGIAHERELQRLVDKLIKHETLISDEPEEITTQKIRELKRKIALEERRIRAMDREEDRSKSDNSSPNEEDEDERRRNLDIDSPRDENEFTSEERELLVSPSALDSEIETIKDQIRTKIKESRSTSISEREKSELREEIADLQGDLKRAKKLKRIQGDQSPEKLAEKAKKTVKEYEARRKKLEDQERRIKERLKDHRETKQKDASEDSSEESKPEDKDKLAAKRQKKVQDNDRTRADLLTQLDQIQAEKEKIEAEYERESRRLSESGKEDRPESPEEKFKRVYDEKMNEAPPPITSGSVTSS